MQAPANAHSLNKKYRQPHTAYYSYYNARSQALAVVVQVAEVDTLVEAANTLALNRKEGETIVAGPAA